MDRSHTLLVTGAGRSGTSLLDKLLTAHNDVTVLSQPLQLLFVELKRAFVNQCEEVGLETDAVSVRYPLIDLFGANYIDPLKFARYLSNTPVSPEVFADALNRMRDYDGQYFKSDAALENLVPERAMPLLECLAGFVRAATGNDSDRVVGLKETFAEEYVPYFLESGGRALLVIRDPRDVMASNFAGRGPKLAGAGRPLLFLVRQWRKSVAFALQYRDHPGFRYLRYEDLVRDPGAALSGVAEWLGVDAFPQDIGDCSLRTPLGEIWASNSAYQPVHGVTPSSIGAHRDQLDSKTVEGIVQLCAPEMRAMGYLDENVPLVAPEELSDPCAEPKEALRAYCWDAEARADEQARLETIEKGTFDPRLHLFEGAFDALREGHTLTEDDPSPWRPVYESRASTIVYNLARTAPSGAFLLPANICPEVPLAVLMAGRACRFVDIDPHTLCMSTEAAVAEVNRTRIGGIVYARTYGTERDATDFFERIRQQSAETLLIDDRCACRPRVAEIPPDSATADAVLYSTGYGKYLDLDGGGFAFLRPELPYETEERAFDSAHAQAVARFVSAFAKGEEAPDESPESLLQRYPNWLPARRPATSWAQYRKLVMEALPGLDRQKALLNRIYSKALPANLCLGDTFTMWRYCISVKDKQGLLSAIFDAGAFASGHYRPVSQWFGQEAAPEADKLHARCVNLFNDRYADENHARTVAEVVTRHIAGIVPKIEDSPAP